MADNLGISFALIEPGGRPAIHIRVNDRAFGIKLPEDMTQRSLDAVAGEINHWIAHNA